MNNSGQFTTAGFSQGAYNVPSRGGSAQEILLSPRIGGMQPASNFYENPGPIKQFSISQGPEFPMQHQGIGYNNYDIKLQNQNPTGWDSQLGPQTSPQFKPQLRTAASPNPGNWQAQNHKYDYARYTSTPKLQPVQKLFKRTWPLLKGNIYPVKTSSFEGKIEIRDVWEENLEAEMKNISKLIKKYKYVGIDTEFPGVVTKPSPEEGRDNFQYQMIRSNVDLLSLIQLGICLCDENGNLATKGDINSSDKTTANNQLCWQFHFKFSLNNDLFSAPSIELLNKSGLNFDALEHHGIDVLDFGELLITSGLVLCDDVHWISFHGAYDFAYLVKIATNVPLPSKQSDFQKVLSIYFPNVYDLKYITEFSSGLSSLAAKYKVARVGPAHQAGSDSLLTLQIFFKLIRDSRHTERYGILHSLHV